MTALVPGDLKCCGLITAHGFDSSVQQGAIRVAPTEESWKSDFSRIIDAQRNGPYNCALIVLSEDQPSTKRIAEQHGFKTIQEFYNPNSGNMCYIMTRIESDDVTYWRELDEEEDY